MLASISPSEEMHPRYVLRLSPATIRFEVGRGAFLFPGTKLKSSARPCTAIPQFESAPARPPVAVRASPYFLPLPALPGDDGVAGDRSLLALLPRLRPREVDGA